MPAVAPANEEKPNTPAKSAKTKRMCVQEIIEKWKMQPNVLHISSHCYWSSLSIYAQQLALDAANSLPVIFGEIARPTVQPALHFREKATQTPSL
jgi:hypothetical protein